MAARSQVNAAFVLTKFIRRAAYLKDIYLTLENQPKSLINEAISLTPMDDSSVMLIRGGKPNNLYLRLARDEHWQRKWITVSSSSADLHPQQNSLNESSILSVYLPIKQRPVNTANVIEMLLRLSPSNCKNRIFGTSDEEWKIQIYIIHNKKYNWTTANQRQKRDILA